MSRVKTFDSTGIAPNGRLYAGDLNAIQDQYADLTNLLQSLSVASIAVGEAGLVISRFGAGVMGIAGSLRITSVVNAIAGFQVNGTALASTHLSDSAALARLASPAFTGTPTAPTQPVGDNSTALATTAWVKLQGYGGGSTVSSVFSRTGAIVAASGDYTVAQVTGAAPLASPTFTGNPQAPTPATADNSQSIATTAFVKAQGYASAVSTNLTGAPTATTPAVDDNSTRIATTAYVIGQAASATSPMNGTAAVGTSTRWARQDHVHPTDTSRAPLASPALTGTPTAPTAAIGDNSTQLATTAFVRTYLPAGVILPYGGSAAPAGWLLCNGAAVNRSTYADLFGVIGAVYGAGDGSTTFNLPDMRGRVPVGKSASGTFVTLGSTGGEETHALSIAELAVHGHTFSGTPMTNHGHTFNGGVIPEHHHYLTTNKPNDVRARFDANLGSGGSTVVNDIAGLTGATSGTLMPAYTGFVDYADASADNVTGTVVAGSAGTPAGSVLNTGSGTAHNNVQPYQVVNYIIKI